MIFSLIARSAVTAASILVPLESLAKMFDIECEVLSRIIDDYNQRFCCDIRESGRNLREFSKLYITDYLLGRLNR